MSYECHSSFEFIIHVPQFELIQGINEQQQHQFKFESKYLDSNSNCSHAVQITRKIVLFSFWGIFGMEKNWLCVRNGNLMRFWINVFIFWWRFESMCYSSFCIISAVFYTLSFKLEITCLIYNVWNEVLWYNILELI